MWVLRYLNRTITPDKSHHVSVRAFGHSSQCFVGAAIVLSILNGCDTRPDSSRTGEDYQAAAVKPLIDMMNSHLAEHHEMVTKIELLGGQVTVAGVDRLSMSTSIVFSTESSISDATLSGLLDGSRVRLYFQGVPVTDAGVANLENNSGIITLNVVGASIGDTGIKSISTLNSLESLCLVRTRITDQGLPLLMGLPHLKGLSLAECKISDAGAASLSDLQELRDLWLDDTDISDSTLKSISQIGSLEFLSLNGTQVSDAGIAFLGELKHLKTVWVQRTLVSPSGVAVLQESLPSCKVHL